MGTTEEALANAEKIGFNTSLFALHPLDKKIKIPIYELFGYYYWLFESSYIKNSLTIFCYHDVSNNPMLVGDELVAIILYFCEAM